MNIFQQYHIIILICYNAVFSLIFSIAVKLGVGGFSMGAAAALYSATCFATGTYNNDNPYPINLSAVVGLSGWLPCSRSAPSSIQVSTLKIFQSMQILISKLFVLQELKKQDRRVTRGCKTRCDFASSPLSWQRYSYTRIMLHI